MVVMLNNYAYMKLDCDLILILFPMIYFLPYGQNADNTLKNTQTFKPESSNSKKKSIPVYRSSKIALMVIN